MIIRDDMGNGIVDSSLLKRLPTIDYDFAMKWCHAISVVFFILTQNVIYLYRIFVSYRYFAIHIASS